MKYENTTEKKNKITNLHSAPQKAVFIGFKRRFLKIFSKFDAFLIL